MGRVDGKVAIVTGAAGGQGSAEAKLLAKEGAKVVATDLNEDGAKEVADEINKQYGDVAIGLKHDVTSEKDWETVVEQAVSRFGSLDVLVNNAGIGGEEGFKSIEDYDYDSWQKFMKVNADSQYLGTKKAYPKMKDAGKGSIINISSMAGLVGGAAGSQYSASKGAIRLFSKATAIELAPYKIRVNSVHPGFIDTAMVSVVTEDEEATQNAMQGIPLQEIGTPDDVAYAVLFLASDESKYITGTEVVVDGGSTAQ